jgi:hypothetical protein
MDLSKLPQLHATLKNIGDHLLDAAKVAYLNHCKHYLELITEGDLDYLEKLAAPPQHQRVLRLVCILERISVNLIIYLSLDKTRRDA